MNIKIDINTQCIKDLLYIEQRKCQNATTFLYFFATDFDPSYTKAFQDIRPRLEEYDLYRRKMNLVSKKRSPRHSGKTPKGGAMHYNHFCLYDNLSLSFQKAFLNNALNVQGCPAICNNNSCNDRFPLLTTQQKQDMFQRCKVHIQNNMVIPTSGPDYTKNVRTWQFHWLLLTLGSPTTTNFMLRQPY